MDVDPPKDVDPPEGVAQYYECFMCGKSQDIANLSRHMRVKHKVRKDDPTNTPEVEAELARLYKQLALSKKRKRETEAAPATASSSAPAAASSSAPAAESPAPPVEDEEQAAKRRRPNLGIVGIEEGLLGEFRAYLEKTLRGVTVHNKVGPCPSAVPAPNPPPSPQLTNAARYLRFAADAGVTMLDMPFRGRLSDSAIVETHLERLAFNPHLINQFLAHVEKQLSGSALKAYSQSIGTLLKWLSFRRICHPTPASSPAYFELKPGVKESCTDVLDRFQSIAHARTNEERQKPIDVLPPATIEAITLGLMQDLEKLQDKGRAVSARDKVLLRRGVAWMTYTQEVPIRQGIYQQITVADAFAIIECMGQADQEGEERLKLAIEQEVTAKGATKAIKRIGPLVMFATSEFKTRKKYGIQAATFGAKTRFAMEVYLEAAYVRGPHNGKEKFYDRNLYRDLREVVKKYAPAFSGYASVTTTFFRKNFHTLADARGLSEKEQEILARADTHRKDTMVKYYVCNKGFDAARSGNELIKKVLGYDELSLEDD